MDESHRYRATAGVRAINELKPILGLELTATPSGRDGRRGRCRSRTSIYSYPLARGDGGRLRQGAGRRHPRELRRQATTPKTSSSGSSWKTASASTRTPRSSWRPTPARTAQPIVKPFMLVIARDTDPRRRSCRPSIEVDAFFEGRYKGKVIQVDSSQTGAEEGRDGRSSC